jgi:RNA polymerase sigma-70 factor (ECF subfamily)
MGTDDSARRAPLPSGGEAPAATEEEFSVRCERLFREHNKALLGLLNAKLHSPVDAKDVAQEAYVRLFQLDKVGTISHLRGWLFKTALNIATDRLRERARRARDEHLVFFHSEPRDAPSVEHLWIEQQDWECLQREVERLPPKCRQAFILIEFDCRTIADVAAHMGVKPNTVYQLVKRAYEHLGKTAFAQGRKRGPGE